MDRSYLKYFIQNTKFRITENFQKQIRPKNLILLSTIIIKCTYKKSNFLKVIDIIFTDSTLILKYLI